MIEAEIGGSKVQIADSERTECEVWTRTCDGLPKAEIRL